jgi:hypothetical protein
MEYNYKLFAVTLLVIQIHTISCGCQSLAISSVTDLLLQAQHSLETSGLNRSYVKWNGVCLLQPYCEIVRSYGRSVT